MTNIKFDDNHHVVKPILVLATRNGEKIGCIQAYEIASNDNLITWSDISFTVYKYVDGRQTPHWDQLQDLKLIYRPDIDKWYEMRVEYEEKDHSAKKCIGTSLGEAELSQVNLYGVEINTENDIARIDYVPTVLFDETDANASLLDRILSKAPHYSIEHVDKTIAGIQRVFNFDNITIYDAFQQISKELHCLFVINSGTNAYGKIARSISVYDLESNCFDCSYRGEFLHNCPKCGSSNIATGYGDDTSIFVSSENLADGITFVTDVDSVKNCFKLVAGDDLMTATIVNCNPNGSNYLWYISDDVRADMSEALQKALVDYDKLYAYYQNEYSPSFDNHILAAYNSVVGKYSQYTSAKAIRSPLVGYSALISTYYDTIALYLLLHDELMPDYSMSGTTAREQANLLTSSSLSPVSVTDISICSEATASNAVLAMAKVIVDPRYQVKVRSSSYDASVWRGSFNIVNWSDENDSAITSEFSVAINDDYGSFVRQRIEKALSKSVEDNTNIGSLFRLNLDNFERELKKYCLVSLSNFEDACQTCIDILIEQGIANNETWANEDIDLYTNLYLPYFNKLLAIQKEIKVRESELIAIAGENDANGNVVLSGMQTLLMKENNAIHESLNFEQRLGSDLWKELIAHRREDTYQNDNFISDGLSDSELIIHATEFIELAKKEIEKSSTMQHSIEASLKNFLAMKEFAPIVKHFALGNWLRIKVDTAIYRLRMISYNINYDNPETIGIEFSDVTQSKHGYSDIDGVLKHMSSMATSYDSAIRQANKSVKTSQIVDGWVRDGLALTKTKIIDAAEDQNVVWDEHGFLCRQYLPITDDYDKKQLKIINRGLYLTDDNWLTSKAGIGDFTYYDPISREIKEDYGVIAKTLVGNLILSEKVGIYNTDNSIVMDKNGILITTNGKNVYGDQKVFTIRRLDQDDSGVEKYSNLFYVDAEGNVVFSGVLNGASGNFTGDITATSLMIGNKSSDDYVDDRAEAIATPIRNTLNNLIDTVDGKTTTFYSSTEPVDAIVNDIWYDTDDHKIMRKTANGWADITSEALHDALSAAGTAQATADGKIVTFAQASQPTAAAVGDLWIDTDDNNKLYRWNGTAWIACRDLTIAAAQSKANDAYNLATNIWNGETGVYFKSSSVGSVSINNSVGVKVVGTDNSYFQVKNNAMGFFANDNTALLYYENGNMVLNGILAANGGLLGGTNGWKIGETYIYHGNASYLGASEDIYFGTDGISFGKYVKFTASGGVYLSSSEFTLSLLDNDAEISIMEINDDGYAVFGRGIYATNVRPYIRNATYNSSSIGGLQGFADLLATNTYGEVTLNYDSVDTTVSPIQFSNFMAGTINIVSSTRRSSPPIHITGGIGNWNISNLMVSTNVNMTAFLVESGNVILRDCWVTSARVGIYASKNGTLSWICSNSNLTGSCSEYFAYADGGGDISVYGNVPTDSNNNEIMLVEAARGVNAANRGSSVEPIIQTNRAPVSFRWKSDKQSGETSVMYQGYTVGKGKCYGCMTFDLSFITGSIVSASLELHRSSGVGYGTYVDVAIYGSTTSYGSKPSIGTKYIDIDNSIDQNETKTYNVTQAIIDMHAGLINQIFLYQADDTDVASSDKVYSRDYAKFDSVSLSVTWEK